MKNILKAISILAAAAVSAGCMKEILPQGSTQTAEQVAQSSSALQAMVNAIPSSMTTTNFLGFTGDHWDFGIPSLHIVYDSMLEDLVTMGATPGYNRYYQWKANRYQGADYNYPYYIWSAYYTYIKSVNDIIGTINPEEATPTALNFLGQAYTWRASYYLDLARLFEPKENAYTDVSKILGLTVPIVTEETTEEEAFNNPRVPREQLYELILSDLANAEQYISSDLKAYTGPSLGAIYGLYARTYLEMAYWSGGESNFAKADEYAAKAITTSGKTPLTQSQWEDTSTGFNSGSSNNAWIWGVTVSSSNIGNLHHFTSMMSNEATWGYAPYVLVGVAKRLFDAISDGDFRKHSWLDPMYFDDPSQAYNYQFCGTAAQQSRFLSNTACPYLSIKFRPVGGEVSDFTTGGTADHPLMRVEEMWFIRMEALARQNKLNDAKDLLNEFMKTRMVSGSSYECPSATVDDFIEEMLLQKRIEFWSEGILIFDYKRLNHGITRGYDGSNEAPVFQINTEGRSPQWNIVITRVEYQSNTAITPENNNPDPTGLLKLWSGN